MIVAVFGHQEQYETPLREIMTLTDQINRHLLRDYTDDMDHVKVSLNCSDFLMDLLATDWRQPPYWESNEASKTRGYEPKSIQ